MSFELTIFLLGVIGCLQSAFYTGVTRSCASSDVWHHAQWVALSNGLWFATQMLILSAVWQAVTTGELWQLIVSGAVYVLATTTGSSVMMKIMLAYETGKRKVGSE